MSGARTRNDEHEARFVRANILVGTEGRRTGMFVGTFIFKGGKSV